MKAISFLGTSPYQETTYIYGECRKQTPYFAEALATFFPDVECIEVLITPTVELHPNWAELRSRLGTKVKGVRIPEGHSEADLWKIFEALIGVVDEGETVIFDITNSFRSLPFLTFLAAAFLRTARQVKVEAIIYGAFDARDRETNCSPVFNLTPFVELLDWLTATNQFIRTGDGRYLADLIAAADTFEHPHRNLTPEERTAETVSKQIRGAATAIEQTSQTLLMTLIPHSEKACAELINRLSEATDVLAAQAPPYRLLAERISETYAPFARKKPMDGDVRADLELQLALVRWYLDKGHIPQAFTLMREWLVSALGYRLGIRGAELLDVKGSRAGVEEALGWGQQVQQGHTDGSQPPSVYAGEFQKMDTFERIMRLWSRLGDTRNLINHGAMRRNWVDIKPKNVLECSEEFYQELCALEKSLLKGDSC